MVFVVAEIGINHNGDVELAKKMIDVAKNVGCDAVKFQKRTVEKVYSNLDGKNMMKLIDIVFYMIWNGTHQRGMWIVKSFYDNII